MDVDLQGSVEGDLRKTVLDKSECQQRKRLVFGAVVTKELRCVRELSRRHELVPRRVRAAVFPLSITRCNKRACLDIFTTESLLAPNNLASGTEFCGLCESCLAAWKRKSVDIIQTPANTAPNAMNVSNSRF